MSWPKGLVVEAGGHGVVSHAGSAATRMLADRTGLTGGLSGALARRGFAPLHDRGRVVTDLAVAIADGATTISEIGTLRRYTGWERRLGTAEQQYQSATARLADAKHEAQLREELIRDREAVARAAARRHYEFALRRTATYQQQLVRTHRGGPELNRLLLDHLVGPDLPAWARDPAADESGAGPDGP